MRSRPPFPASVAAVAAASLLAAGCGGGSATTAATTAHNGLLADVAYSQCMRSHGVATFPDPSGGRIPKDRIPFTDPRFASAANACNHVLPSGGSGPQTTARQTPTDFADSLAFARCLRAHGFPSFPDPTNSGEISHEMLATAGINVHEPAVRQAADACVGVTYGTITTADVARFIAGG